MDNNSLDNFENNKNVEDVESNAKKLAALLLPKMESQKKIKFNVNEMEKQFYKTSGRRFFKTKTSKTKKDSSSNKLYDLNQQRIHSSDINKKYYTSNNFYKNNNNNNENNIINENKNNNINSFIKFKKPELQKKKIFKIEKIFDKEEYENATQIIESKKGNFPLEMQRQLFYKNILKIMTLNNLRQTYIETIKINKSNLLEKTLELMIKNNINETSIKKVLKKKIIRSRHHYIIYSTEAKKFCIDLIKMSKWNSEIISLICEVPSKNIKRWIKLGVIRKKGGGRKTKFPNLEKDLVYWFYESIDKNFYPIASDIRNKALEICNDKDFLASKGWLDKFIKKYGITPFIKKDRVLINKMGYSEWIKYKYPSGNIN